MAPQDVGLKVMATATNATSAVATITGVAGQYIYVTDVTGSSDKAGALILIKDGSTTIWQDIIGTTPWSMNWVTPLRVSIGANLTVTVDGTAACKANVSGTQS